jgi:hypothetical protein
MLIDDPDHTIVLRLTGTKTFGSPKGYPQTPGYEWWRRHDEYEEG